MATNAIHTLTTAARAAGYHVGIARGRDADRAFRIPGRNHGHAYAVSIYTDKEGTNEVARLVWSYISADRIRFGYVLSFAGLRDGKKFRDVGEVRKVWDALKLGG